MTLTDDPRQILITAAQRSVAMGLNRGTVGNFSLRHGAGMLITPTGILPEAITPDQIVEMDLQGNWQGDWRPSSEWEIHAKIYAARPDAGAVVHTHSDHATALSALRKPIPPFHYMICGFGGNEIPCAEYACFGTPELSATVIAALGDTYGACLMANHGVVTLGATMEAALGRGERLEMLAKQYLLASSAGTPVLLNEEELRFAHIRYRSYGQQACG
ncbi:class II aldolase/adducin family protein [Xinfangfangia sp. CPCC 101601]|uniref:Class II aldolase/adducin family protein n=1 Tax=Pseudogemmobacter lacusdianii TaxID=3069608 RepID=A0ABU0W2J4_9RHOB|nr:class II aldolase/adducin family protein [Xinfangfangia sp. CPCC 101601]MDQ2068244.1 class II aldolase/adducin family protein [Xinfangfangia sp. CPCC 101601]